MKLLLKIFVFILWMVPDRITYISMRAPDSPPIFSVFDYRLGGEVYGTRIRYTSIIPSIHDLSYVDARRNV